MGRAVISQAAGHHGPARRGCRGATKPRVRTHRRREQRRPVFDVNHPESGRRACTSTLHPDPRRPPGRPRAGPCRFGDAWRRPGSGEMDQMRLLLASAPGVPQSRLGCAWWALPHRWDRVGLQGAGQAAPRPCIAGRTHILTGRACPEHLRRERREEQGHTPPATGTLRAGGAGLPGGPTGREGTWGHGGQARATCLTASWPQTSPKSECFGLCYCPILVIVRHL